jgi:hypothetical protein
MTRQEYKQARRLLRDNGAYAFRWIEDEEAREALRDLRNGQDLLAERLDIVRYCQREGVAYTFNHLRLLQPYWSGLPRSTAR